MNWISGAERAGRNRILIADQERTLGVALAARLKDEDDINVVGAVQVTKPRPWLTARKSVDVIAVDGDLPGAAAWVRKDQSLEHLLQVIRGVARGDLVARDRDRKCDAPAAWRHGKVRGRRTGKADPDPRLLSGILIELPLEIPKRYAHLVSSVALRPSLN